jgi:hypothetical protein
MVAKPKKTPAEKPVKGRSKHPFGEWLGRSGPFVLRRGEDYACRSSSIGLMIRAAAGREPYRDYVRHVSISVADDERSVTVHVNPPPSGVERRGFGTKPPPGRKARR